MTTYTSNMSETTSFILKCVSGIRPRDRERRFLQRYGWTAYETIDRNGGRVWLWSHSRYRCSYYRNQAFVKELARQAR